MDVDETQEEDPAAPQSPEKSQQELEPKVSEKEVESLVEELPKDANNAPKEPKDVPTPPQEEVKNDDKKTPTATTAIGM